LRYFYAAFNRPIEARSRLASRRLYRDTTWLVVRSCTAGSANHISTFSNLSGSFRFMAPVRRHGSWLLRLATVCLLVCAALWSARAHAQVAANASVPPAAPPPSGSLAPLPPAAPPPANPQLRVLDIRIEGNHKHSREQVLNNMATRIDRPFDQAAFEKDIRKLTSRNWFVHVVPKKEYVPGGVVITLVVVERPVLEYVRFFGNEKMRDSKLAKETGLKKGDSFDPYAVREAARKIETLYQTKGFNDVWVDVPVGTKPGDAGAVFLIHEGKVLKFSDISFKGNSRSIAPDGRLKKIIDSREPLFFFIKGQVDRVKIESDVEKLTDYYRSLGFFKAHVSRIYEYNNDEDRLKLTFYIYEGPRYHVNNISFLGNDVYPEEALNQSLKLNPGDFFDQSRMNSDIGTIKDLYGSNGYVFTDAVADLRFFEEPGPVDIIYRVKEGQQYRIGDINVTITGDNPHTRHATILNRLSMRPGDIADIREFRSSERRIKASGLFNVDPTKGDLPRIVFSPPDLKADAERNRNRASAKRTGNPDSFRGQSPDEPQIVSPRGSRPTVPFLQPAENPAPPQSQTTQGGFSHDPTPRNSTVRGQSPDGRYEGYGGTAVNPISPQTQPYAVTQPGSAQPSYKTAQYAQPAQNPLANDTLPPSGGYVPQDFGTSPEAIGPGTPFLQPTLPVDVYASEAQTGRFMLGAGVNSNAGLVGSIILDEQNFDWRRWPTSWEDFRSGRAFRGAGQKFRLEAAPGTQVQRYLFNFAEPFLFDTPVSFGLTGYYFNRFYRDWIEQRLGGRVTLGYQFSPDLSGSVGLRAEDIVISQPRVPGVPDLDAVLGHTSLYSTRASIAHDTRDSTFLPTEGHYITATFEYFMGTFQYPWVALNAQQHWLLRERPDGTGRHTFSYYNQLGFSGPDTPIYERFYAGGFSTLRGFQFRGASPQDMTVLVGGDFQFLNTLEYMFPITADDMLKMVAFVDFGTVESDVRIDWDQFRIAPGLGIRVTIPMISPAPIAIDIAVPVKHAPGDLLQNVSFFVGVGR
jgi:outer membrane protein insertion porin family